MAAANTTDIRTHVLGDLYMMTGTFTDGGIDVSYGDHLSTVLASGGHVTSIFDTGINLDDGDDMAIGDTAMVVDALDVRLHFNVGETIYSSTGTRIGVITAITNATALTIGAGVLEAVANNANLFKLGPEQPAVSIDETNQFVVFGTGNVGAASTASTTDGRWWILGQR